ncbi:MAG: hypothetical protein IT289_02725 [Oligoflexia bacterium]|nr:hypothetical protein [Oligoflexia bacterium]
MINSIVGPIRVGIFVILSAILLNQSAAVAKPEATYDYRQIFELARETLIGRPTVKKFLKEMFADELTIDPEVAKKYGLPDQIKEMSEAQFVLLLQKFPQHWPLLKKYLEAIPENPEEDTEKIKALRKEFKEKFKDLFEAKDIVEIFSKINDPTRPMILKTADGSPGILGRQVYFSHLTVAPNGALVPPVDLASKWIEELDKTKSDFMINVFEFDLERVADAAIRAVKDRGVKGIIGIDKNMAEGETAREPVKRVVKKLKDNGVQVELVDPVNLNHQKLGVFDRLIPGKGTVIAASANLTASCSSCEGDLEGLKYDPKYRKLGKPNANHLMVIQSPIFAELVAHELTKTLVLKLRGSDYPLGGAYRIEGPNGTNLTVAFTPRGGYGNINRDMLSRVLYKYPDQPIYMMAFANSSDDLEATLLQIAETRVREGKEFEFHAIGDRVFAVAEWSGFLSMSGFERDPETKEYRENKKSPWFKLLGEEGIKKLRSEIFVSPLNYREFQVPLLDGTTVKVAAKVHHKLLIVGPVTTLGSSYNQSANADNNQEQILIWLDPELADISRGAYEGLRRQARQTVAEVVQRKNDFLKCSGANGLGGLSK